MSHFRSAVTIVLCHCKSQCCGPVGLFPHHSPLVKFLPASSFGGLNVINKFLQEFYFMNSCTLGKGINGKSCLGIKFLGSVFVPCDHRAAWAGWHQPLTCGSVGLAGFRSLLLGAVPCDLSCLKMSVCCLLTQTIWWRVIHWVTLTQDWGALLSVFWTECSMKGRAV